MKTSDLQYTSRYLVPLAAMVVIIFGISIGEPILTPLLLSYFIAILLNPVVNGLARIHIPRGLSILLVISMLLVGFFLIFAVVGKALKEFAEALPGYRLQVTEWFHTLQKLVEQRGLELSFSSIIDAIDSTSVVSVITSLVSHMGSMTSTALLILLCVIFMLIEAPLLRGKLTHVLPYPERQLKDIERFIQSVNHYVVLKTLISLLTGLLVSLMLWAKGVNFYILGGLLAFLLNYIPNVGSILSAIPGVLVTILQLGMTDAMSIALGYLVINMIVGNFLEPKVLGRGLGLSSLTVFLSLIIWGWLLGPIGMLLSVPLTISIKILLESSPSNRQLAILLGTGVTADKEQQ